jgi:hypothetical protein
MSAKNKASPTSESRAVTGGRGNCPACRFYRKHGHVCCSDFASADLCREHVVMKAGLFTEWQDAIKHWDYGEADRIVEEARRSL